MKVTEGESKTSETRLNGIEPSVCQLGRRNSTGSPIFLDSQSELSRVNPFPPLVKRNEDSRYEAGFCKGVPLGNAMRTLRTWDSGISVSCDNV